MKKLTDLEKLGEFGLIERVCSRLSFHSTRIKKGIGDDCAVFSTRPKTVQLTSTDALIESIHFNLKTISPMQLGRKAMAVNISDIAAMGGTPYLALISLGLPALTSTKFVDKLYSGLQTMCDSHKIELAGGDTVASPKHLFINVCVMGEAFKNRVFYRTGAKPGDQIFVTGNLGDSAMGLEILMKKNKKFGTVKNRNTLVEKHLEPIPRVKESSLLAKSRLKVTSMVDISDGLTQDLGHLCIKDNLGANLYEESLPVSEALHNVCLQKQDDPIAWTLEGGEDYELLFTIKSEDVKKLKRLFLKANIFVSHIGEIIKSPKKIILIKKNGSKISLKPATGFNHFKQK
jgi:thiamine-monophosphate kinase